MFILGFRELKEIGLGKESYQNIYKYARVRIDTRVTLETSIYSAFIMENSLYRNKQNVLTFLTKFSFYC